jgi:hypothetical protein
MARVLTYVMLFPFLMGLPFLGLASTGTFGQYVLFIYTLMIIPALLLAATDFLLSKHLRWQGVACAIGGSTAAIASVTIGMGALDGRLNIVIGFMGALAGTLCWMGARGVTIMEAKA